MKDVQCYELFEGIALKNHAFSFFFHFQYILIYLFTYYNSLVVLLVIIAVAGDYY